MMNINKLSILSALFLCASEQALASFDSREPSYDEGKSEPGSFLEVKTRPSFKEIIQEKQEIQKESMDLQLKSSQSQGYDLFVLLLFSDLDRSSPEFLDLKEKILSQEKNKQETTGRISQLEKRNEILDKVVFESFLDIYREEEHRDHPLSEQVKYEAVDKEIFSFNEMMIGTQKVIQVPQSVPNTASQRFFALHDSNKGLWFGLELLLPDNISWWKERLGWEATMQFGKPCKRDFFEKLPILLDSFNEIPLDLYIQQVFFSDKMPSLGFGYSTPSIKFLNEFDCMALRSLTLEEAPSQFQSAYEAYEPSENQHVNYLAAFRGFKMNLDRYAQVPTWVAYVSSEKIEAPLFQTVPVTSSSLKMAMTVTAEPPFYSPLGIFNSPIARAFDTVPCTQISIPFHSAIAKLMEEITPKIKFGITRPLENMSKIFSRSGLRFSSTFGNSFSGDMVPTILRESRYELSDDEVINFHNYGYTPFVLFDPRTKEIYQIGNKNPFSTNYYLGGIPLRDMKFPFIVFDREELSSFMK